MLRPVSTWLLRACAAGLAGLSIGLALVFWRLATAGLSLSFVTPYVNAALQDAAPGYRITLGGTELFWNGFDAPLAVIASDVRIAPASGRATAVIPSLLLDVALRPLLDGEIQLIGAEAVGALLHLTRNTEGNLGLAVRTRQAGPGAGPSWDLDRDQAGPEGDIAVAQAQEGPGMAPERDQDAVLVDLVAQLLAEPADGGMFSALQSFGVSGSRLVIDDAMTGRSWQADQVRLIAGRGASGIELRGGMQLDLGSERSLPIEVLAFHRLHSDSADIRINGGPFYPAELATSAMEGLRALEAPLLFDLGFRLEGNRLPSVIEGRFHGPVGRLRLPGFAASALSLSDLDLRFRVRPRERRIEVSALSVDLAGSRIKGRGELALAELPEGMPGSLLPVHGDGDGDALPRIASASWQGRIGPVPVLELRDRQLHVPATPASASTAADLAGQAALDLAVALNAPLDLALRYDAVDPDQPGLRVDIVAGQFDLTVPDHFEHALAFRDVALNLDYDIARSRLFLRDVQGLVEEVDFAANVRLDLAVSSPPVAWQRMVLTADLGSFDLEQLLRLWPRTLAPPTRDWFARSMEAGRFIAPQVSLDLERAAIAGNDLSDGSIDILFGLDQAVLNFLTPMSPIRNLKATARLTQDEMTLVDATGNVDGISLDAGSVMLTGLQKEWPRMDIRFTAGGQIDAILAVLDQPPLELSRQSGVLPGTPAGDAALDVILLFPVRENLTAQQVQFAVTGPLTGIALPSVVGGFDLEEGDLQIRADPDGFRARGTARLAGLPVELELQQPIKPPGPARLRLVARLEEAWRQQNGFDLAPFLRGPVGAAITLMEAPDEGWELGATLDLVQARLTVPSMYLDKLVDIPASASLRGRLDEDGLRNLRIDRLVAPGLDLEAALVFADGRITRVDLNRLRSGQTALSGWAQLGPDGIWSAMLQGAQADLRPYLENLTAEPRGDDRGGDDADVGPERLDADLVLNVARAIVTDDYSLADLAIELALRSGRVNRLEGQASLPPGSEDSAVGVSTARLRMARDPNGLRFAMNADDAGRALRAFGFEKLRGGSMVAVGSVPIAAPGQVTARAVIRNTQIVNVPRLQVLVTAPATGDGGGGGEQAPRGAVDPGGGIPIDLAEVDARLIGETLFLDSVRARGPAIGLTMQGEVGLVVDRVALTGTFVPAYALNTAFGQIPIIGDLLIGREGEGLIGFTFRVAGPFAEPEVDVNPLSGLAPGFLRRLFEFTAPDLTGGG